MKENLERTEEDSIVCLIRHWSEIFNLPIGEKEELPSKQRMLFITGLINEEFFETLDGVDNGDIKEVKDGLGDLLWVVIRAMLELGIDPQKTIEAIYDSNMSKVDVTEEDAMITKAIYHKQNIATYVKEKEGLYITHRTSDDKVLKGRNYKAPEL